MKSLVCHAALAIATLATTALADPEHDLLRERIKQQEETIRELKEKLSQHSASTTQPEAPSPAASSPSEIPSPSIEIPPPSISTPSATAATEVAEAPVKPASISKAVIVEAAPAYYAVQSGDHLTKIASKHNTSVEKLLALNPGINPNALRIGQRVNVPSDGATETAQTTTTEITPPTAPAKTETPAPRAAIVVEEAPSDRIPYTVQQGDTMFNLSRKHNTTVAEIQALNPGLDPRKMWAGKRMYLPAPKKSKSSTPTTTTAAVAKPEPVPAVVPAPVAKKEPVPAPIPEPVAETPTNEPAPKKAPSSSSTPLTETASNDSAISGKITTVTVKEQMTFGDFAAKHKSTVDKINILNGLDLNSSTVLAEGSELYVPRQ